MKHILSLTEIDKRRKQHEYIVHVYVSGIFVLYDVLLNEGLHFCQGLFIETIDFQTHTFTGIREKQKSLPYLIPKFWPVLTYV